MRVRIGLHLGEVIKMVEENTGVLKPVGLAINLASRVMQLALPGQILMTRAVFDEARLALTTHPSEPDLQLEWPAHGRYLFQGKDEPMEVFEAGVIGVNPLTPPPDSDKARRAVAADEEPTLGWRPGISLKRSVTEGLGKSGWLVTISRRRSEFSNSISIRYTFTRSSTS